MLQVGFKWSAGVTLVNIYSSVFIDIIICKHQYLHMLVNDSSVFDEDRISSSFDSCIKDTIWFILEDWFDISGNAAVDWRYAWKVSVF